MKGLKWALGSVGDCLFVCFCRCLCKLWKCQFHVQLSCLLKCEYWEIPIVIVLKTNWTMERKGHRG